MPKAIIIFYSFEGSTKKVAEFLSKELNLPNEEIKPINDLKSKGFSKYFLGGSQVTLKKKPKLKDLNINLDKYDTVILGSPIWAGSFAPGIRTLLEDGELSGKKIAFFYCHRGGPGKAEKKIEETVNMNNEFIAAYGLAGVKDDFESLKDGLLKWVKEM